MKKERKKSTFWQDFKAFISRGNIIDLAVGLVVGAAFTAIVNSLVNDIIKPFIALLVGGNFSELVAVLRPEEVNAAGEVIVEAITLNYGNLIMAILTFLIDAFVIFTILRIVRYDGRAARGDPRPPARAERKGGARRAGRESRIKAPRQKRLHCVKRFFVRGRKNRLKIFAKRPRNSFIKFTFVLYLLGRGERPAAG